MRHVEQDTGLLTCVKDRLTAHFMQSKQICFRLWKNGFEHSAFLHKHKFVPQHGGRVGGCPNILSQLSTLPVSLPGIRAKRTACHNHCSMQKSCAHDWPKFNSCECTFSVCQLASSHYSSSSELAICKIQGKTRDDFYSFLLSVRYKNLHQNNFKPVLLNSCG